MKEPLSVLLDEKDLQKLIVIGDKILIKLMVVSHLAKLLLLRDDGLFE